MKLSMAMKLIVARRRKKREQLAAKRGISIDMVSYSKSDRNDSNIISVLEMLDALDYQMVFQPKGDGTAPEGVYCVRWSDYQKEE